jgi:hypothetical protein
MMLSFNLCLKFSIEVNCGTKPDMLAHGVTPPWAKAEPSGHHLIFDSFHRTHPYSDDRYHYNFMGARIAHELERDLIEAVPTRTSPTASRPAGEAFDMAMIRRTRTRTARTILSGSIC